MAKEAKKTEKTAKKAIGASAKDMGFAYGVPELADALGIEPASVRVALRNKGVEKNGNVYGWKNQKDFDAVVKQLQKKSEPKAAKADTKADTKKADAKKAPAKTATKSSKSKGDKAEAAAA